MNFQPQTEFDVSLKGPNKVCVRPIVGKNRKRCKVYLSDVVMGGPPRWK